MTVAAKLPAHALPEYANTIGLVGVASNPSWRATAKRLVTGKAHSGDVNTSPWRIANVLRNTDEQSPQATYEAISVVRNGHTAMLARVDRQVTAVVGWNPKVDIVSDIRSWDRIKPVVQLALRQPITTAGRWHDNSNMIADPTAIAFEAPVPRGVAQKFAEFARGMIESTSWSVPNHTSGTFDYCFDLRESQQSATGEVAEFAIAANCVVAAIEHLVHFLTEHTRPAGTQSIMATAHKILTSHRHPDAEWWKQGRIMQCIPRWQEQIDAVADQKAIDNELRGRD